MANKEELIIKLDFDRGCDIYNEKNPEKREIDRTNIVENEGVKPQSMSLYKKGEVPQIFHRIFSFLERNNLELKDVLSVENSKGKKIF